jgi:hypothetical protein
MAPMIAIGVSILVLFFCGLWPPEGTSFTTQRKEMPDPAGTFWKDGLTTRSRVIRSRNFLFSR